MKIKWTAEVKNAQKNYNDAKNASSLVESKYEKMYKKAKCFDCELYYEFNTLPFIERHKKCTSCKFGKEIMDIINESKTIISKQDRLFEEYAKEIFNFLSKIKPNIYNERFKKSSSWESIFPNSYNGLNKSLKNMLISLAEGNGIVKIV